MPELTMEQLGTFRPAKSEKKAQLAQAGTIVVLDGETVVATRKVGRPQKSAQEKEMVRSIRLSESFLARLKARAEAAGYTGWQTYAKKLLEDALNA